MSVSHAHSTLTQSASAKPRRKMRIPVLSSLADAIGRDINLIFYILVILLTLLVFAVKTWGLVALTMAALPMVPVMFAFYIYISLPR
jgi:Na+/alanine symporter